ncbi:MAG: NUDIX domain-containing protein [Candidatus Dojkabacteria bacterium]|jgi:predicted NUDIX family phosphoesterase
MPHKEKICCIKEEILFSEGKWNGLKTDNLSKYISLINENMEFHPRDELEENPKYKQIIAQVILKHKDKYFLHRQVARSEKRLNSLCPLPVGGHIEEFDNTGEGNTIENALVREMNEEVSFDGNILNKEFLGLIYIEDENPVNRVHVGFVYIFELDSDNVHTKEEGLEDIGFVDIDYLNENINNLTYWSREIISFLK